MELKPVEVPHHVEYSASKPYDGIFKYIQDQTGITDIGSYGYVHASSLDQSSISQSASYPLITKNDNNTYFKTITAAIPLWYEIDLNRFSCKIESYTYKTYHTDWFKEWYVYGSNDRINYQIIHHVTNYSMPSQQFYIGHFNVDRVGTFRYILLKPVGINFKSENFLAIHRFELFGTLVKRKSSPSCYNSRWKSSNRLLINSI